MKWTYGIKNKLFAAVLLFLVMALVLLNNFNQRANSTKISKAINSIYDDRLIAESYLFQYQQNAQHIDEIIDNLSYSSRQKEELIIPLLADNKEVDKAYLKTKLTQKEALLFKKLQIQNAVIETQVQQKSFVTAGYLVRNSMLTLKSLSELQVTEAKNEMMSIKKLTNSAHASNQFEIAVLIIIGIIIQALVFASKTLTTAFKSEETFLN